jgi:lipopolysaccharide/colanic/teichoic acid biosynthesis glycosyltransferase
MVRTSTHNPSRTHASFDPFEGPCLDEGEGLDLVDLMSFSAPSVAAAPASVGTAALELELHHNLGLALPRWDQLEPTGLYARFLKPVFTLLILLVALPASLLVMAPIAVLNWFAHGDHRLIFFTQERVGQYGRVFRIYKFRTMRPAASEGLADFEAWSDGGKNRVTALGRFLRSTHLDEVPQILNIVMGDMDFIGPRPEMVSVHNWACREVPGFERRLAVRPGITGLAQITQGYAGACPDAYGEKLAADDRYREQLSFGLELSILARTAAWMLRGRGWKWNA